MPINISDLTEENIQDMLNMVFCACNDGGYDGLLSLDESTGEVCGVNSIFFQITINCHSLIQFQLGYPWPLIWVSS